MEVRINKTPGLRNDLLVTIPRSEIDDVLFHIANRSALMKLPGLLRHRSQDSEQRKQVDECKVPVEQHLKDLGVMDDTHRAVKRVIAIGSRNIGNNHGYVAWQADETPRLFHVLGEPFHYSSYSCIVRYRDGRLGVRDLRFDPKRDRPLDGEADVAGEFAWCVFANRVLRNGQPVNIDEIIDQFYDIHHVLALDRDHPIGRRVEEDVFRGYPDRFRENALRALLDEGVPRNRFLHNCVGLSEEAVVILQREGTIEEMANWLRDAGARDGFILDNGGSAACWAWWPYPNGGFLFSAPDYRPNASAVLAFLLKGPACTNMPSGSVSCSVV